jgi:hypothetical protein
MTKNRNMKDKIASKLNIIPILIISISGVGIFTGIGIMLILRFYEKLNDENDFTWSNIIFPFFIFLFVFYTIYYLLTNFPKITVDKIGIKFSIFLKTEFYHWNEIEKIKITGKEYLTFLISSMPMEATTINLKNGNKKIIWADNYINTSELRVIFERAEKIITENKSEMNSLDFKINNTKNITKESDFRNETEFNGNHILSVNGIMFYGFMIFVLFMIFQKPNEIVEKIDKIFFISIIGLILCSLFSYQMNYFIVTDKLIIVKNTIWFWINKVYLIEDIKEIVIEQPHKSSISLRIITNDFSSKIYKAGSLRDKTWTKLKENLIQKKLNIRNETHN